jgi:hypothetical protein
MNVRKERTHQCGLTNLDFRTKGDHEALNRYQPDLKRINFGTMGSTGFKRNASESKLEENPKVKVICGFNPDYKPDPKSEAALTFY